MGSVVITGGVQEAGLEGVMQVGGVASGAASVCSASVPASKGAPLLPALEDRLAPPDPLRALEVTLPPPARPVLPALALDCAPELLVVPWVAPGFAEQLATIDAASVPTRRPDSASSSLQIPPGDQEQR